MKYSNKGFSFVEILIVVTILAVISIIASTAYSSMQTKSTNAKVVADLRALNNSLQSYSKETQTLPMPKGNLNYYKEDTSYSHNLENSFGVSGYFYEGVLPKKYLSYLPYDPKTAQLYAYAKTTKNLAYEVGGVIYENELPVSVVMGNWGGENGPYNLIKEYSGPNFVSEGSKNYFPYNPYEKRLVAKINSFSGPLKIDDIEKNQAQLADLELIAGNKIEVSAGGFAEIYISDGSSTIIGDKNNASTLEIKNFNFKDNTNIFTSVKLALLNGSVWTKAAKLDNNSSFEISTPDTVAAVRGTIFGVTKNVGSSQVTLIEGKIDVKENDNQTLKTALQVEFGDTPKGVIIEGNEATSGTGNISQIPDEVKDKATKGVGDFSENIQLKVLSKTGATLELELNDITKNFNKVFVNDEEIFNQNSNGLDIINYEKKDNKLSLNNLDFSEGNEIKLCKNDLCTKTLDLKPIDGSISFDDLDKKDKILALNDPDNLELNDLENLETKVENPICGIAAGTYNGNSDVKNCLGGEYELIGYAPYDEVGDLNMYKNSSINEVFEYKNDNLDHASSYDYLNSQNWIKQSGKGNFYTNNEKKLTGIYFDRIKESDYLYYKNVLNNYDSYAIEIGVRGAALKRSDSGVYTLFSNNNNNLYIKSGKLFMNGNSIELNNINNEKMYSIIVKFGPSTIELSIIDYDGKSIDDVRGVGTYTLGQSLYIGVQNNRYSYDNQWNDIIDYVKVYKKNNSAGLNQGANTAP